MDSVKTKRLHNIDRKNSIVMPLEEDERNKLEQLELIRSLIAFNDHQNVREELCHSPYRPKGKKKQKNEKNYYAYLITSPSQ